LVWDSWADNAKNANEGDPKMNVPTDPELEARYLSLSLFAQNVSDALIDFVAEDKSPQLEALLEEAGTWLRQQSSRFQPLSAFNHYEQVKTLGEICDSASCSKIVETLERLRTRTGSPEDQRNAAEEAIRFFYDLANQALRNFDRPTEFHPLGIQELCNQK
jgi:hypothetical protein